MYTQVSDAKTASKDLKVTLSYRPQGGSWTTPQTLFNSTSNYWYTDWSIPVDATPGLYDVKVLVVNGSGGSASSTITGQFNVAVNPNPIIVYVSSWVYPDNQQIDSGGTVYSGKTLKIYTQVSDAKTASKNLAVAISCRPQGGSWITPQSLFNSTSNYWYTDWSIPIDATPGLYDVNVNVDTPDKRSTINVISNVFNVVVNPSPVIIYVRSWVDPENQFLEQGGNVSTGKTFKIYTQVSDAKTASANLTVAISYRPKGGSWTTPAASYNPVYDYWYINWTIPSNATTGSYDVGVDVANQDHRSTTSTISNAFNIRLKPSVLVIYEDEASFWTPISGGSGGIDISVADQSGTVHSGTSALRYQIVAGTKASVDIYHNYTSSQDWSGYGALDFWWYGRNTGARFDIRILGPDLSNQFSSSFADDFMGWQKVTLPMGSFTSTGSPKWWNVTQIQIGTSAITPTTWYLDTTTVEPASIVYVRSWVSPDNQPLEQGGTVSTGKSLEMYAQVSDAKTASKDLTVNISYRPQGGSWTTPTASYDPTYDYWYIIWMIPSDATTGSYDVKVDMSTPDYRSTKSTIFNAFNVCNYVLSMPFANASVPVKDLSGYGNDGTPYNVTWQSNYGGCYSFNGVNSYINRQNMTGLSTTQFSFSFWSKQSGTSSNYMHLIGLFGDHRATIYVAPNTYKYVYKFSNVSGTPYEGVIGTLDSGWHYTAVVLDGSRLRVYVDGFERVNIRAPGVINKIDDSLFVGTSGTGATLAGNYFNGLLDGISIYGRVLSAGDVQAEFNAGKAEHGIS